jgi:TatA/E family protein of Tat protein translocase
MFGIGMPEFILIAVVALIVFGPKKLPELAKSMGRAVREFRKATTELKETMQVDSELSEVKKAFTDLHSEVNTAVRKEAEAPAAPAPALPAPEAMPSPPPAEMAAEPTSAQKLEELKKAFDAWSAAKTPPPDAGDPPPQPPKQA